jgi:hypothetical protein
MGVVGSDPEQDRIPNPTGRVHPKATHSGDYRSDLYVVLRQDRGLSQAEARRASGLSRTRASSLDKEFGIFNPKGYNRRPAEPPPEELKQPQHQTLEDLQLDHALEAERLAAIPAEATEDVPPDDQPFQPSPQAQALGRFLDGQISLAALTQVSSDVDETAHRYSNGPRLVVHPEDRFPRHSPEVDPRFTHPSYVRDQVALARERRKMLRDRYATRPW